MRALPGRVRHRGTVSRSPDTERAQVLALINQPKYADLAICQIWAREFDEGNYLCSTSSMYRVAKAAGQTRERRRQATHPAKVKPELLADGPSQVWTWDITKLRGPAKGLWYHLYVIIDIFSRYNPSRLLSATESGEEAEEFIEEAVSRNGAVPHTIHADRGTSMTSGRCRSCSPTSVSPDPTPAREHPTTTLQRGTVARGIGGATRRSYPAEGKALRTETTILFLPGGALCGDENPTQTR